MYFNGSFNTNVACAELNGKYNNVYLCVCFRVAQEDLELALATLRKLDP